MHVVVGTHVLVDAEDADETESRERSESNPDTGTIRAIPPTI